MSNEWYVGTAIIDISKTDLDVYMQWCKSNLVQAMDVLSHGDVVSVWFLVSSPLLPEGIKTLDINITSEFAGKG